MRHNTILQIFVINSMKLYSHLISILFTLLVWGILYSFTNTLNLRLCNVYCDQTWIFPAAILILSRHLIGQNLQLPLSKRLSHSLSPAVFSSPPHSLSSPPHTTIPSPVTSHKDENNTFRLAPLECSPIIHPNVSFSSLFSAFAMLRTRRSMGREEGKLILPQHFRQITPPTHPSHSPAAIFHILPSPASSLQLPRALVKTRTLAVRNPANK